MYHTCRLMNFSQREYTHETSTQIKKLNVNCNHKAPLCPLRVTTLPATLLPVT